ncbi:MAG: hypothetical protein AAF927_22795 [Bacteroidota bacterium]
MRYFLMLLPVLFLFSCGESKQGESETVIEVDPIEKLKNEAIAIHDEVMPLMGPIDKLKKDLDAAKEQLVGGEFASEEEIQDLSGRLHAANESMMKWMNDYATEVVRKDGVASEETLEGLKTAVEKVKENMESAKTDAEALLAKLK